MTLDLHGRATVGTRERVRRTGARRRRESGDVRGGTRCRESAGEEEQGGTWMHFLLSPHARSFASTSMTLIASEHVGHIRIVFPPRSSSFVAAKMSPHGQS
eukprot:TRINITY_DN33657_c0_g1_i1.p2 TRINITY_DN33657_c0_g1~~TRINITY_DN33657_c0_g1_i1.p2  ORF type:complete len:101 (-),score=1.20 TRINITY_DN33657_c0_g1_i1:174-476(-)